MAGYDKNWLAKVILLKAEGTEGTDAGPAVTTDAIRVLDYQPTFLDATQKTRTLEKAYFGADPTGIAALKRGASFKMDMAGGGAATTVPPWMKVLQYCGMGAGAVGSSSVVQAPITTGIGSATHYIYIDDLLAKSVATRGKFGFTIADDEYPFFSIDLLGIPTSDVATQVAPGTPTISGYIDPLLSSTQNTTFTFNGYAFPLRSFTLSDNATVDIRSLIGPNDRVIYSGRSWSGTMVIQVPDLTVKNPFTGLASGAVITNVGQIVQGVTAGNIVQIDMPRLQVSGKVDLSNEQGKLMATFPITALPNVGNDEILFTSK